MEVTSINTDCKVLVITGSSRGLGYAIATHYLSNGWLVYGCSRGEGTITHSSYTHASLNISNESEVRSWIKTVFNKNKRIDALVCNAGLVQASLFMAITPGDLFNSFLDSNVSGVFYPTREVAKCMTRNRTGRIILISSTMVAAKQPGTAIYSSTKAFGTQMMKVLAKELSSCNVTCNIIAPAMMNTESSKELSTKEEWKQNMLGIQTFPRVIESEEILAALDYFLSNGARSVTGQVINIGLVD
jgi:3-oxoacyl-[acyl-carrier protein] reductase